MVVFIPPPGVALAGSDRPPQGKLSHGLPWPVSPSKMILPPLTETLETEDMKLAITASFVSTDLSQPVATEKTKDRDGCQSGSGERKLWPGRANN